MTVRTRIAPSPTGDPHVGTAYMALFNWAFARQHDGQFVLRIEDTDQARSTPESEQAIFTALRWLGLDWDEGPNVGGPYGPYRQSERQALYLEHIEKLLEQGDAFHCFCSKQRLDDVRAEQQAAKQTTRYDGHCLGLSADEVAKRLAAEEPSVVRMRVPETGACTFKDRLRGEITIPYSQIDMQVLLKADGMPTYHLAVVVDDHLMGITHILRGEEWLNSVPKHQLLYQYFDWPMPELVHLPLLRNTDQSKLSKRKNPTSVTYYRDQGYLPEALLNYLGLMGWSMPDEQELFTLQQMVQAFDVDRISTSGPIFDQDKLRWMNGQYLRALDAEAYAEKVQEWLLNKDRLRDLIPLVQERAERLSDLLPLVDYLLGTRRALKPEDFAHKKLEREQVVKVIHHTLALFDRKRSWQRDDLYESIKALAEQCDLKLREFLFPLFIAISGREVSLPLFDSLIFLGPDLSRGRLRDALEVLAISGKERKRLDKALDQLQLSD
ncbi:MAG: glutamate--tRNA ligase [Pseudomonadota bacterium]|nr:glutamate--tRNA ligase [Pseudomonadota bacterium]MEC8695541.1 glutamate--tRNA ligase [Pseudomonadota bacterium]